MQLGPVAIKGATKDQSSRAMGLRARPVCTYCGEDFGRVQELNRHVKDIHMPRRRCPFCDVTWTRPAKIKAHLIADHAEEFTEEVLIGIKALCGRRVTEFLDAYDYIPTWADIQHDNAGQGQISFSQYHLAAGELPGHYHFYSAYAALNNY